jgi:hypothetical protein
MGRILPKVIISELKDLLNNIKYPSKNSDLGHNQQVMILGVAVKAQVQICTMVLINEL